MLLLNGFSAALVVFAGHALAKDRTECYTAMTDRNPGRYPPTQWTTHYAPCTTTSTSTLYHTSTPTTTKTRKSTKYTTVTNEKKRTATSTKVETVTQNTITTTTSVTTTTTAIKVQAETTVPAPAAFTPIQVSFPGSSFTNDSTTLQPISRARSLDTLAKRSSKKQYPKMVLCHKYTKAKQCATKKVTVTRKKLAQPSTYYTTVTRYATTTVCPEATTTLTVTSVTTSVSTATTQSVSTTTSTTTTVTGTNTVYEICLATANYANQASGQPFLDVTTIPENRQFLRAVTVTENAYQCCNAAIRASGNAGDLITAPQIFVFQRLRARDVGSDDDVPQDSGGACNIFGESTCPAQQNANQYAIDNTGDPDSTFDDERLLTVGNAPCGEGVPEPVDVVEP